MRIMRMLVTFHLSHYHAPDIPEDMCPTLQPIEKSTRDIILRLDPKIDIQQLLRISLFIHQRSVSSVAISKKNFEIY